MISMELVFHPNRVSGLLPGPGNRDLVRLEDQVSLLLTSLADFIVARLSFTSEGISL